MFAYYADYFFGLHPAQSQREWMLWSSVVGKIKIQDDSMDGWMDLQYTSQRARPKILRERAPQVVLGVKKEIISFFPELELKLVVTPS